MGRFINPFTDVGFKRIFGQEINKDLLIDFLNALLEGEKKIKDITFLDKELLPEFEKDRSVIYDVYCTDESNEQFIVEMQNREHVHFRERAVYYLSRAIARQGEKGSEWMFNIKAVYGVFFMNFRMPGQKKHKLRTDVELADRETGESFSNKMRFIFLELPAFEKEEDDCQNDFERWIYVLKHMDTLQRMPFKARKSANPYSRDWNKSSTSPPSRKKNGKNTTKASKSTATSSQSWNSKNKKVSNKARKSASLTAWRKESVRSKRILPG